MLVLLLVRLLVSLLSLVALDLINFHLCLLTTVLEMSRIVNCYVSSCGCRDEPVLSNLG